MCLRVRVIKEYVTMFVTWTKCLSVEWERERGREREEWSDRKIFVRPWNVLGPGWELRLIRVDTNKKSIKMNLTNGRYYFNDVAIKFKTRLLHQKRQKMLHSYIVVVPTGTGSTSVYNKQPYSYSTPLLGTGSLNPALPMYPSNQNFRDVNPRQWYL